MDNLKKINAQLSAAGQPSPEDLQQAADAGFKSVLNLRSSGEINSLPDEQEYAEAAGLNYANVPLDSADPDGELLIKALWEIEALPKPILVHCGAGQRAGAVALIATAFKEEWTLEQLTEKATEIGLSLDQPHLKQFIQKRYGQSQEYRFGQEA